MTELAAANGAERAQALLKLTQRLTDLIRQETSLFKERRPQDAIHLQDEKSQLANIYRAEVSRARQCRDQGSPAQGHGTLPQGACREWARCRRHENADRGRRQSDCR